jgi:hypothetical protein
MCEGACAGTGAESCIRGLPYLVLLGPRQLVGGAHQRHVLGGPVGTPVEPQEDGQRLSVQIQRCGGVLVDREGGEMRCGGCSGWRTGCWPSVLMAGDSTTLRHTTGGLVSAPARGMRPGASGGTKQMSVQWVRP